MHQYFSFYNPEVCEKISENGRLFIENLIETVDGVIDLKKKDLEMQQNT